MTKKYISPQIKELLRNERFLLWCFSPTPELEETWQKWSKAEPGNKEAMEAARKIVLQARINDYRMPEKEADNLLKRIRTSQEQRRKRSFRLKVIRYAAAVALLIAWSGIVFNLYFTGERDEAKNEVFADAAITIDKDQKEVELIVSNQKKMVLGNKVTVSVTPQGDIKVDSKLEEELYKAEKTVAGTQQATPEEETAWNVLKVPYGRRSHMVLADGTKIWVNSGSIVRFPAVFNAESRTIYIEGEAYLTVARDTAHPFIVKTHSMDVQVLGTAFNVKAYPDDGEQSVVLCEGSVSIAAKTGDNRLLKPNEMLTMSDETLSVSEVDVYLYTSWTDGVFAFADKNLEEVTRQLTRYYGMEIGCTPDIQDYICSGKLVLFDDVHKVMQTLCRSFPISYKNEGETIVLTKKKP